MLPCGCKGEDDGEEGQSEVEAETNGQEERTGDLEVASAVYYTSINLSHLRKFALEAKISTHPVDTPARLPTA